MTNNGRAPEPDMQRPRKATQQSPNACRLDAVLDATVLASLSTSDQRHLVELQHKLQLVRDRTTAVAVRYSTGFFLHGSGGVSKSYTVIQELQRLEASYRVSNSRLTGRGLFDVLAKYPGCMHVIEDAEQMLNDKHALGVLRSALWGQRRDGDRGPQERWVTWSAHRTHQEILFSGGIILVSNRPLPDSPELQALKSRVPCMHFQPSDNELRGLMRYVAKRGFEHEGRLLDPEECEFVLAESLSLHRPLDMRCLINSFCDYLQWQEGDAGCHWHDLVAARVRERPTGFRAEVVLTTRAARKQRELEIAREIMRATRDRNERGRLWHERTGKSEKALYRRLSELKDL